MNKVFFGDCRDTMRTLIAQGVKVQMCVTSPPYFGLRDYGHAGQIGLEATPAEYVANMVDVFSLVRELLADDGVLWLNLGDSYAANRGYQVPDGKVGDVGNNKASRVPDGLKAKDLIGIPWRVAFALQADGWYLRQDIIWHKPNPMPESVTDRCTKAHEYIFMLSKSARYYYDQDAIKEPAIYAGLTGQDESGYKDAQEFAGKHGKEDKQRGHSRRHAGFNARWDAMEKSEQCSGLRNKRSVWTVATKPYSGAHFATFPPALIEPCILAGSRPAGRRCDCEKIIKTPTGTGPIDDPSLVIGRGGMNRPRRADEGSRLITRREQRWHAGQMRDSPYRAEMASAAGSAFDHYIRTDDSGARPLPEKLRAEFMLHGWITEAPPCSHPIEPPDIVLDPFFGSGTTGQVAQDLGRQWIGCELNEAYSPLQQERTAQAGLELV